MDKYLIALPLMLLSVFAQAQTVQHELSVSVTVVEAPEPEAKSTHEQLPDALCEQAKVTVDHSQDMDYLSTQLEECKRAGTIEVVQLY